MFNDPQGFYMAQRTIQPVALAHETRATLPTPEAAFHLNRAQQTLRLWHCNGTFPEGLRPVVVNGRLGWPTAGIKRVLGVA